MGSPGPSVPAAALSISTWSPDGDGEGSGHFREGGCTASSCVSPHGGRLRSQKVAYDSPLFRDTARPEKIFTISRY